MIYSLYLASLIISVVLAFILAFIFWQRRTIKGSKSAAFLMAAAAVYALGNIIEILNTTMSGLVTAVNIQYIGIVAAPLAWYLFSLRYTGRDSRLTRKVIALQSIIPVVTVLLAWTNGLHELIWYNRHLEVSGPFIVIAKSYGPWFWVHTGYSYLLLLTGTLTIIRRLFRRPYLYRQQSITLIIIVLVPLTWNVLYVFNIIPIYRIDLTPSAFALSGLVMLWGLFKSRLFDIIPIAYDSIMESALHCIIILDTKNRVLELNRMVENVIGWTASKAIGRDADEVLASFPEILLALREEKPEPPEITVQTGDTNRYYLVYVSQLTSKNNNLLGRMISLVDNTGYHQIEERRKELENRAQLLSRLSTAGEMAAGIAHEVNNPLATVIGYTALLLKSNLPESIRSDIEIIDRSANRAAAILERLLTFSGKLKAEREPVEINRIIETAVEFRRYYFTANNIELTEQLEPHLPMTMADGSQILEVFLNLIMNAESAIIKSGNRGKLVITTETKNNSILISFKDNGTGIKSEDIGKVFNPFFTTKKTGEGMGLGLSICHGIITAHHGEISVQSRPGFGTTFSIELPVLSHHMSGS